MVEHVAHCRDAQFALKQAGAGFADPRNELYAAVQRISHNAKIQKFSNLNDFKVFKDFKDFKESLSPTLPLGNAQINLALPSLIRIFVKI